MSGRKPRTPTYRHHKARDYAVVTLDGKDHYLGPHNSPESREKYDQLIAEWLARGRRIAPPPATPTAADTAFTINELILRFVTHATTHYRSPDGTPTSELSEYKRTLGIVRGLYGRTAAAAFGPLALKAVREKRLMYADALQERGFESAAAGIRAQVANSDRHRRVPGVRAGIPQAEAVIYRRGFPDEVVVSWGGLVNVGDLLQKHPIQAIRVSGRPDRVVVSPVGSFKAPSDRRPWSATLVNACRRRPRTDAATYEWNDRDALAAGISGWATKVLLESYLARAMADLPLMPRR